MTGTCCFNLTNMFLNISRRALARLPNPSLWRAWCGGWCGGPGVVAGVVGLVWWLVWRAWCGGWCGGPGVVAGVVAGVVGLVWWLSGPSDWPGT